MKGGTLFSGIGSPEVAAPWIDWRWCAEIEPFACAVHAAHFPGVPNLGDITKIDPAAVEPVDVIVFGSPCVSFSVAGKRLGLDDPRGNLALVALRLVAAIRPRWFLFENVPGLLSSDGGRDFGTFLASVDVEECEALQGLPRSYTLIRYRGKPAADGPRYRSLGNSMAVPCVRWILQRLITVHREAEKSHYSDECPSLIPDER